MLDQRWYNILDDGTLLKQHIDQTTTRCNDVGLTLDQRHRWWPNIKTTLVHMD